MRARQARVAAAKAKAPKRMEMVTGSLGAVTQVACECGNRAFALAFENATQDTVLQCATCKKVYKLTAALLTTSKKAA